MTEKLSIDMLEMILGGDEKRLDERTSKFLLYQVGKKIRLQFKKGCPIMNSSFFLKRSSMP